MERRDFIKLCALLGLSSQNAIAFTSAFKSKERSKYQGEVIIIGAGAAGLSAGYLLHQLGTPFHILESAPSYGGRMKHTTEFTDFPISLGGEWLHVNPNILTQAVNNPEVDINLTLQDYKSSDTSGYFDGEKLTIEKLGYFSISDDKKFVGSSWLHFFETYIVPTVQPYISFNTQVSHLNYGGKRILLEDAKERLYEADKVIVTVPLQTLKNKDLAFSPPLPSNKSKTIQDAPVWTGIKVFIEFKQPFYPTFLHFPDSDNASGQRLYYDAAYGQNSKSYVLGLFAVGEQAKVYQAFKNEALRDHILQELDTVFDGKASKYYVKHITQNWEEEPFIHSAYLADNAPSQISNTLFQPVDNKLFFCGEAYTKEDDWGGVHNAIQAAHDAVDELLKHQ